MTVDYCIILTFVAQPSKTFSFVSSYFTSGLSLFLHHFERCNNLL